MEVFTTGLAGAAFGLFIPVVSRRFGKFMPCNPGTAYMSIFHRPHFPKARTASHKEKYDKLLKKLILSSFLWAALVAVLSAGVVIKAEPVAVPWYICLVWVLCLSSAIDQRFQLLPDVLTIPLLVLGFGFALWGGDAVTPEDSATGAIAGYFVPVVAGMLMHFRQAHAIGGGDVKMLAALGAWLGPLFLNYAVVLSFVAFFVIAVISREKAGPYGPALAIGTILALVLPLPPIW